MPSNHTPNYGLCQWETTDKVLHDDFNEDNIKIDTALAALAKTSATRGNCEIFYQAYTGTGTSGGYTSFSFRYRPIFFIITGGEYIITALYGSPTAQCRDGKGDFQSFPITWGEHRVLWKKDPDKVAIQGNVEGIEYQVMMLLDMEY